MKDDNLRILIDSIRRQSSIFDRVGVVDEQGRIVRALDIYREMMNRRDEDKL